MFFSYFLFAGGQRSLVSAGLAPTDALVRFAPTIYQTTGQCIPSLWADAIGNPNAYFQAINSCSARSQPGQVIGKKVCFKSKWALVYTAWYPINKVITSGDWYQNGAANWVTSVVWLNSLGDTEFEWAKALQIAPYPETNKGEGPFFGPGETEATKQARENHPPADGKCVEGTETSGAGTSSGSYGMSSGAFGNPIKAPIGLRSSIYNTFITKESAKVGSYWSPGISDNLTVNNVVDYDVGFAPDFPLHEDEGVLGHTFPFTRGLKKDEYLDPGEESLNCYYEDIVNNQWDNFYGGGTPVAHCI